MASVQHQNILVGIETDPTRYHGENASRPALLDRVAAEQVLAHLATDLTSLFPAISFCTLTMAGALFDQTGDVAFSRNIIYDMNTRQLIADIVLLQHDGIR